MAGIEVHRGKVRVYFQHQGEKCREPFGPDSPESRERAQAFARVLDYELQAGTFDYARHFPESRRIARSTFGHYLEAWLTSKEREVAASSIRSYRNKSNKHLVTKWGHRQIHAIEHVEIRDWIAGELNYLASKTIKEVVAIFSQVMELYVASAKATYNPAAGIVVRLPDAQDPDPFTLDEIEKILAAPTHRPQPMNLMRFMLWDGSRLSEACALCWEDVEDLEAGMIRYRHALVEGGWKVTKNKRSSRRHRLLKPAREALLEQHAMTAGLPPISVEIMDRDNRTLRKRRVRPIFLNDRGRPFSSDLAIREKFWRAHLERAGVRYRGPGNARHTFISQMLSTGLVPIHWIADHVGHSSIQMIQQRYGKWIHADGPDIHEAVEKLLDL